MKDNQRYPLLLVKPSQLEFPMFAHLLGEEIGEFWERKF